jgi:hypothetical protein
VTLNVSRAAAAVAAGVLALGGLAALAVIARGGEFDETDWRLVGTLGAALFCGSGAVTALRFRIPYRVVAALPVAAFAFLVLALWSEELWEGRGETIAKAVLSVLAVTLAVLLIASLRLQTPFTSAQVWFAFVSVSALIVITTVLALVLLWSWNAPFIDGGGNGGTENVANVAQRILLALFSLSVVSYLGLPLLTRLLTPRDDRDH